MGEERKMGEKRVIYLFFYFSVTGISLALDVSGMQIANCEHFVKKKKKLGEKQKYFWKSNRKYNLLRKTKKR